MLKLKRTSKHLHYNETFYLSYFYLADNEFARIQIRPSRAFAPRKVRVPTSEEYEEMTLIICQKFSTSTTSQGSTVKKNAN